MFTLAHQTRESVVMAIVSGVMVAVMVVFYGLTVLVMVLFYGLGVLVHGQ